jgi:PKD repeat protein
MNNGEIYTPSVMAQAKGLQNVVADVPVDSFRLRVAKQIMSFWVGMAADLIEKENYETASTLVENLIEERVDSCFEGSALFDWIIDCEAQAKVYYPVRLLGKTLGEITGKLKPPLINASVDVTTGRAPLEVKFTGTATDPDGTIASYWWDFGDGESSTEQNPTYTYKCPGDYDVSFGVVDNDGIAAQQTGLKIDVDYPEGFTASFSCDLLVPVYQALVCTQCHHKGDDAKAGLDLSSYDGIMAGSNNGPAVIPGDPENSVIVQITDPPRSHASDVGGKALNQKMRATQRAWIAEGALDN